MGYRTATTYAAHKFEESVSNHKPLGLDRKQEIDVDGLVRKHHPKGQEQAEDASTRADGRIPARAHRSHNELQHGRTNHRREIEHREALAPPRILNLHAKHPEGEHIEQDVAESAVQKAVRDELPRPELPLANDGRLAERPEPEPRDEHGIRRRHDLRHEHQPIENEQVLDDRRKNRKLGRWLVRALMHYIYGCVAGSDTGSVAFGSLLRRRLRGDAAQRDTTGRGGSASAGAVSFCVRHVPLVSTAPSTANSLNPRVSHRQGHAALPPPRHPAKYAGRPAQGPEWVSLAEQCMTETTYGNQGRARNGAPGRAASRGDGAPHGFAPLAVWVQPASPGAGNPGGTVRGSAVGSAEGSAWRALLRGVVLLVVVVGAAALWQGATELRRLEQALPAVPATPAALARTGSVILAADGTELGRLFETRQEWVALEDVSPHVIHALLATEDHRFYEHAGVDWHRLVGAAWETLWGNTQGASTIPMQLSRVAFPAVSERPLAERKVMEILMARRLVRDVPRDDILEWYLNVVPFGYSTFGIEAAAGRYFSTRAVDLSLTQASLLVGMLQGTTLYNPIQRPRAALTRRRVVLGRMVTAGFLDSASAIKADRSGPGLKPSTYDPTSSMAPHFRDYVQAFTEDWALRNGFDVHADALQIHTTLDTNMQQMAVLAVERQVARLQRVVDRENGLSRTSVRSDDHRLQAGFVAIDPATGYVKAWVGGLGYERDQFDKVASAHRQPGSTFKPFVYGAALRSGFSPHYLVQDRIRTFRTPGRGRTWTPTNSGGAASGRIYSLEDGIVWSKNTVAAHLMSRLGPGRVVKFAEDMGIVSNLLPVPSLALGTSEVTLLELAGAYATMAAGGMHRPPNVVSHITDRNGEVVARFFPEARQGLDAHTNYTLLDMMRGVVDRGTGSRIRTEFGVRGDLAGKTGTTQHNADGWFLLMHPDLVTGAWVGFNDQRIRFKSNYWGQGGNNALLLVGDFMRQATTGRGSPSSAPLLSTRSRFRPPPGYRAPERPVYSEPAASHTREDLDT